MTTQQQKINKYIQPLFATIIIFVFALCGCKTIVSDNKTVNKDQIQSKIDNVTTANINLLTNETNKMSLVSDFSYGIQYTLSNDHLDDYNKLWTSDLLNTRILSISGYPSINNITIMEDMIDNLNGELKAEQEKGQLILKKKDKEIQNLLFEKQQLEDKYNLSLVSLSDLAKKQASKADSNAVIVDNVNKYFGLGAVYYGLKKFISTFIFTVLIVIIIYLILRVLSTINPIVGAVFSVIEMIISYVIKFIKVLAPGAPKYSGLSETCDLNKYRNTLMKIVDSIEILQTNLTDIEKGNITLNEIMTEFSSNMDSNDKAVVREIKSELKW